MKSKVHNSLQNSNVAIEDIDQSIDPDDQHSYEAIEPIVVLVFGKGGVGKTLVAQVALIALQESDREAIGIDADASNSSLKRQLSSAIMLDMSDSSSVVSNLELLMIEHVFQNRRSVVIDTGGGSDKAIRQWLSIAKVQDIFSRQGVGIVALTVIDSSLDAASHVMETADTLQGLPHVLVMNLGHTPGTMGERAFQPLMSDHEFRTYVKAMPKIVMPRLPDAVELDGWGARLHTINHPTSPANHNPFVVDRTETWIKEVSGAMLPLLSKGSS